MQTRLGARALSHVQVGCRLRELEPLEPSVGGPGPCSGGEAGGPGAQHKTKPAVSRAVLRERFQCSTMCTRGSHPSPPPPFVLA